MGFLTIEITSKKVRENNVDFSTIKITSKKIRRNNMDFSIIEITSKKVFGNNVNFSVCKIISKKGMEMTWKFVEIGLRRIDVISTSNQRGFSVECPLGSLQQNSFTHAPLRILPSFSQSVSPLFLLKRLLKCASRISFRKC